MSRPTIVDVAARAGVSKSLVSLVMRGAPNVSDERRRAVERAARELGYRPNAVARSLVRRRTHVLGVMLSNLHNPFFADVVDGIDERAAAAGYRALINSGSRVPRREAEAIETLLELRTDGIILAGPVLATSEIAAAARTTPVVLVCRAARAPRIDSVVNDDRAGAALAVEHLASLGHRRIAHIDGGRGAGARGRRSGYEAAMRRLGLGRHVCIARGDYTEEGGAGAIDGLFAADEPPTALFAANDLAALGALDALAAQGLRVPRDVSVVGYDNTALAGLRHIGLTTIDQPRHDIGRIAVELMLERLEAQRTEPRRVVLAPSLVVRKSTRPPRSGRPT